MLIIEPAAALRERSRRKAEAVKGSSSQHTRTYECKQPEADSKRVCKNE